MDRGRGATRHRSEACRSLAFFCARRPSPQRDQSGQYGALEHDQLDAASDTGTSQNCHVRSSLDQLRDVLILTHEPVATGTSEEWTGAEERLGTDLRPAAPWRSSALAGHLRSETRAGSMEHLSTTSSTPLRILARARIAT